MDFMILKVNGRDLSQATHEEAVEAFRTAQEPILVEVLRRVNKNKMKTRSPPSPSMVSVSTQTEEDIYGYNRPPTPPPAYYPFPASGLYQPGTRRPLVFSANPDMGLTDIEMAQFDYEDPYFDDRQYEVEYEEIILQRLTDAEKLGLTLCYGSGEDGITDIYVGEIDPYSVAAKDGRMREGDQIVQINGVDVQSRDQAIQLFSEKAADISLVVARPQLQIDDGFMDEHNNVVLADLQDILVEKRDHHTMQIMASMLARGHHFDEEGGTTDTGTTENSSHKHEKDSGVGRTDESTKNDESSEQDAFDTESMSGTRKSGSGSGSSKGAPSYNGEQHYSNNSFDSAPFIIPEPDSEKFCKALEHCCDKNKRNKMNTPKSSGSKSDSQSESSIDKELAQEMEGIQMECQELFDSHAQSRSPKDGGKAEHQRTARNVPRMGTRLEYVKHGGQSPESPETLGRRETPQTPKMGQSRIGKTPDRDGSTSAYNTGESCRSTPLTLELNMASDEGERGFKNSMLCLATTNVATTPPLPIHSDTEKQTQTPSISRDCSSDEHTYMSIDNGNIVTVESLKNNKNGKQESPTKGQLNSGESLQDLYMQYADVMYTNHANLEHTMQVQQKLFQQQLDQRTHHRRSNSSSSTRNSGSKGRKSPNDSPSQMQGTGNTAADSSGQMEWVVKRRPDGTRYITRRPIRSKLLKERAKKISEERCGMTTDDDAMSELKTGRYWTKEERKRQLEKARDHKKKRELIARAKMETLKESDEKKDVGIVELSHRKMMKHKGKRALDNFTTVQEMLAHGNKVAEGKQQYNPLLSVTTV